MTEVRGGQLAFGALLMMVGGFVTVSMLGDAENLRGGMPVLLVIMGVLPLGLGARSVVRAVGPALAARRFGEPVVTVTPSTARVGDDLEIAVAVRARVEATVERVRIELVAWDVTTRKESRGRTRVQEVEAHRDGPVLPGRSIRAGKRATFRAKVRVPEVWPSVDGRLRWAVQVEVALAGSPDWQQETAVHVVGGPA